MLERRANHAITAMKERIHIRAAERCGARHAGAPEFRAPNKTHRHGVRRRHAAIARNRRVAEIVVGHTIGGVLPACVQAPVPLAARKTDRRRSAPRVIGARFSRCEDRRMGQPASRPSADQLNDACHCVASEQRGLGATDNLNAFDEISRQVAEVERAARLVQRNAVEQHFVVAAFTTADEQRRHVADSARSHDSDTRRAAQQFGDHGDIPSLNFFSREHSDRRTYLTRWRLRSCCGDDDRLTNGRDAQGNGHRVVR